MTTAAPKAYVHAVRIAAALAAAAVLAYVVARAVVPDGTLTVRTDLRSPAPFVSEPKPTDRLLGLTEGDGGPEDGVRMIGEPVYLDLEPPSRFETVDVTVRFRNQGHGIVEIGALSSSIDGLYDVRPAQALLLDSLNWDHVSSGKLTLYSRRPDYASIDEFLRDPPARERMAVYAAYAPGRYRPTGAESLGAQKETEVSLRGSHRMYVATDGSPITVRLWVQDMNRQDGADPVILSVYGEQGGAAMARAVLEDDGNTADDQRSSGLREVTVSVPEPEPGAYKVEFTASADVFIRRIRTAQHKLVFADRLYLGDHVGYSDRTPPIVVQTDGAQIVARTPHVEALQTLDVAGRPLELRDPNVRYAAAVSAEGGIASVTSPKRDVLLETDGVFALSKDSFFDPRPFAVSWYTTKEDLDARRIDHVLTTYEPPRTEDGTYAATATFAFDDMVRTEEGKYRFAISAPGIDRTQRPLIIESVTFTLRRDAVGWAEGIRRLVAPGEAPTGDKVLPDGKSYGERVP